MKIWKRLVCLGMAYIFCINVLFVISWADVKKNDTKNMTVMIYMVGSDLESECGNASADLQEIMDCGADTRYNNIVVYTGGASAWQIDELSADEDSILQLSEDGLYVVDRFKARNMGDPDTLSSFINYCYENYESEKYSLILWDHGSGAVLGFGYDENYEDILSLEELRLALETSVGKNGRKLELVGFDACIMSSLEVADVFAPYAGYLVASQETEPGWGWDYSFLSCLTKKKINGAKLGENIVDAYVDFGEMVYEVYPDLYCDLTLSVMDLGKYETAEKELNTFFESMCTELTVETFPKISRSCYQLKGFGEYSTNSSYGMLDSVSLIHSLAKGRNTGNSQKLIDAIEEMVVYARGNVDGASGISICYPNNNKETYQQTYSDISEQVGFADEYLRFLSDMNGMKANRSQGRALDVSDVVGNVAETEVRGEVKYDISVQLSEGQQKNISKANVFLVVNLQQMGVTRENQERMGELYRIVYFGKNVPMDENGICHAYYANNAIYGKNTLTEEITDIPLFLTELDVSENEKKYTTWGVLFKMEYGMPWQVTSGRFQILLNDDYPDGQIGNMIPLSDSDIPDKQLICINNYDSIEIGSQEYYLTRDEGGKVLPIPNWENGEYVSGYDFPCAYFQTIKKPIENPEAYYYMFVFYDFEGNMTSTELFPLVSRN